MSCYFIFFIVLFTLLISSNGQFFMVTEVCDSSTTSRFRYNNNTGFETCQFFPGNPTTYEFVPVCNSSFYTCVDCSLTCQNGGACILVVTTSVCLCPPNWGGSTCGTRVNNCVSDSVCLTDGIAFTQCVPSTPYSEPFLEDTCQLPGVNCDPSSCSLSCQNNGRCVTRSFQGNTAEDCICANGYSGTLCDTMTTPFNVSTLCSAGYNVSALWILITLAVFALYVISVVW